MEQEVGGAHKIQASVFTILIISTSMGPIPVIVGVLLLLAIVVAGANVWARRAGYSMPGQTAVRCSAGHVFETTWVMGGSLTTIRLGPLLRYGRCPVGDHWANLRPVKAADLTDLERRTLDEQAGA
jgi:hypothetical protein